MPDTLKKLWSMFTLLLGLSTVIVLFPSQPPALRPARSDEMPPKPKGSGRNYSFPIQETIEERYVRYSNETLRRKRQALQELGELVQRRLHYIQNPKDCRSARKLVCDMSYTAGYGSLVHHVVVCLVSAYATNRTLVLESKGWYGAADGWESVFEPLSSTCTTTYNMPMVKWEEHKNVEQELLVKMPHFTSMYATPQKYPFLPHAIPEEFVEKLSRLHGDPVAWWVGQFVSYLTRPNVNLQKHLNRQEDEIRFRNPIVGLHVRRSDKINDEALFHPITEYMSGADKWFEQYEKDNPGAQRVVYLASEDPQVWFEAEQTYPGYTFVSDVLSHTGQISKRYSESELRSIVQDVYFLSMCDYIVCTFSSNVCRLAYELMQTTHGDATDMVTSLDYVYFFAGRRPFVVTENHTEYGQLTLKKGDVVLMKLEYQSVKKTGLLVGIKNDTGQIVDFPVNKTRPEIVTAVFPTYPEVEGTESVVKTT